MPLAASVLIGPALMVKHAGKAMVDQGRGGDRSQKQAGSGPP